VLTIAKLKVQSHGYYDQQYVLFPSQVITFVIVHLPAKTLWNLHFVQNILAGRLKMTSMQQKSKVIVSLAHEGRITNDVQKCIYTK